MEILQVPPGSPLEIIALKLDSEGKILENGSDDTEHRYLSSIFDVTKGGELIVHMPTKQGHLIALAKSVSYQIVINTHAGIFSVNCHLVNKGKLENFPVYIFKPFTDIKKIQRREYYRFACSIPVVIYPITRENAMLPNMDLILSKIETVEPDVRAISYGTILDISGGGARINSKVDIDTDSYMVLKFDLVEESGIKAMEVVGRRVRSQYKEDLEIYEHRVEFMFKENDIREIIIKYIFDEERRLRKKNQG